MEIKTIANEVKDILIVEKSKFIAYLFPCDSKKQIDKIVEEMNVKYADATHVCYAYIVNDDSTILYKANDDGEPSQTAGAPILNVLKKNNLMNVLCVVVRYFGGIKLGAGGLTRTYTNSAAMVVNQASIVTLIDAYKDEFVFPYDKMSVFSCWHFVCLMPHRPAQAPGCHPGVAKAITRNNYKIRTI